MIKYLLCFCTLLFSNTRDGQLGIDRVYSAHTSGHLGFHIGLSTYLTANDNIFQKDLLGGNDSDVNQYFALSQYPSVMIGLGNYVDASVTLPVYTDYFSHFEYKNTGIGDFNLRTKFRLPLNQKTSDVEWALLMGIWAGNSVKNGAKITRELEYHRKDSTLSPFGQKRIHYDFGLALTYDFTKVGDGFPLLWHLNSFYFLENDAFPDVFKAGTAFEFPLTESFHIQTHYSHQTRMEYFNTSHQWQKEVNLIGLNLQFQSARGFYLKLGVQKDFFSNSVTQSQIFNSNLSIKANRALTSSIQFGWKGFLIKQDKDKDGFEDSIDKCPSKPEDKDGFEDFDGCPEIDNDNDKIWDAQDRCPLVPEDIDGFEDGDGCPEFDNDKDGLTDTQDNCPLKAEDKDGFEDFDGCPEFDNDNDNIPDAKDKCANQKEDIDSFEDEDGCPEFDNDKDGIPDDRDQCPNHPETINNIKDQDGCPENEQGGIIGDFPYGNHYDIVFVNNTTQFTRGSFRILDRLAQQLKTQNQIKLQVKVHYDNSIGYEKAHMLTAKQARAIKSYLVSHQGVPHQRIIASGVGMGSPVASNKNPKGRLKNRRIELLPYQN